MRNALKNVLVLLSLAGLLPGASKWEWLDSLPKPWTLDQDQVSQLLPQFRQQFPDFQERLKAFALWRVGTPYEIFKLGEEAEPDPDPLIRLDVSDCTGHVLTCLAFTQSSSWEEARRNMITIHYKPGPDGVKRPTYKSRWHYTADRVTANPYTVSIVEDLVPRDKRAVAEVVLNIQSDGSEFLDLDWKRPIALEYIPNDQITSELLAALPAVCGVSFVRKSYFSKGIIFAHEGMIIDRRTLIHASQSAGETVRLDFMEYYFPPEGALFDGIVISKFVPVR